MDGHGPLLRTSDLGTSANTADMSSAWLSYVLQMEPPTRGEYSVSKTHSDGAVTGVHIASTSCTYRLHSKVVVCWVSCEYNDRDKANQALTTWRRGFR
jgi:hypothetical protein